MSYQALSSVLALSVLLSGTVWAQEAIPEGKATAAQSSSVDAPAVAGVESGTQPAAPAREFRLRPDGRAIDVMIKDGSDLSLLRSVTLARQARTILQLGDFAFLINRGYGVTVMNLRDPYEPESYVIEGRVRVAGLSIPEATTLRVRYQDASALAIYDITEPARAVLKQVTQIPAVPPGDSQSPPRVSGATPNDWLAAGLVTGIGGAVAILGGALLGQAFAGASSHGLFIPGVVLLPIGCLFNIIIGPGMFIAATVKQPAPKLGASRPISFRFPAFQISPQVSLGTVGIMASFRF